MNKSMFLSVALLALTGCETLGGGGEPKTQSVVAATATPRQEPGVVLGAIPEAGLPKGECGMILWTLDESRAAPVFRYIAGKQGEIVVDGAATPLARVEMAGANGFGVFEEQTFTSETGLSVKVNVRFSLGFDGGSYLERGLITVESANGWRTVAPSAGLAGCRS